MFAVLMELSLHFMHLLNHVFIIVSGCRCPASRQSNSPQDRDQGEACKNVQNHPRCGVRLRLQNSVWRWQDNRVWHDLRLVGLRQEE